MCESPAVICMLNIHVDQGHCQVTILLAPTHASKLVYAVCRNNIMVTGEIDCAWRACCTMLPMTCPRLLFGTLELYIAYDFVISCCLNCLLFCSFFVLKFFRLTVPWVVIRWHFVFFFVSSPPHALIWCFAEKTNRWNLSTERVGLHHGTWQHFDRVHGMVGNWATSLATVERSHKGHIDYSWM